MPTQDVVAFTPGAGDNGAAFSISETGPGGAVTKKIVRYALSDSSGTDLSNPANPIGSILGVSKKVSVQSSSLTLSAYAANAVVQGILTLSGALAPTTFSGVLQSLTLKWDHSVQTMDFWVGIFSAAPTSADFTNNTAAAISAADSALLLGVYHLSAPQSPFGTHTIYNLDGIGKVIVGGSQDLSAVVVPGTAMSAAPASTTDMTLSAGMLWG